jgi:hypothetical protein
VIGTSVLSDAELRPQDAQPTQKPASTATRSAALPAGCLAILCQPIAGKDLFAAIRNEIVLR